MPYTFYLHYLPTTGLFTANANSESYISVQIANLWCQQ